MKTLTLVCTFLALSIAGYAQNSYTASKQTSLSGTAEVVTVQGTNAAGVRLIRVVAFKSFDATCSVACTITLERDGTAATTTTLATVGLNLSAGASTVAAFSSSNVGVGTVLAQYNLTAGASIAINLTGKQLYSGAENLTIRTSSITGVANLNIQWSEN